MTRRAFAIPVALLIAGAGLSAAPAQAEDSMARAGKGCAGLVADYPNGIARSSKAARTAVRAGYRKPFVCKRVYRSMQDLDANRNGSVCERKA